MILVGAILKVTALPPVSVTLMGKVALGWPEAPPDELESPPQAATRRPRRAAPRKARSQGLFASPSTHCPGLSLEGATQSAGTGDLALPRRVGGLQLRDSAGL